MIKKIILFFLAALFLLVMVYGLGPQADIARLDTSYTQDLFSSDELLELQSREKLRSDVKPGNESELIWTDPTVKEKTRYSVVYLHGFSASPVEGEPLHKLFAERYGFNLYIPRLFEHGLEAEEPLIDFTAEGYLETVKEAILVGKSIGEEVILIACSTGATAGLYMASDDDDIAALILLAPNIYLANPASALISWPWGKELLEQMLGGKYQIWESIDEVKKYWYTKYRYEAIVELMRLINATMTPETFKNIDQPLFAGYYYKNEAEQDDVVSVPAILNMVDQIKTPIHLKRSVAFPEANTHVISSPLMNPNYQIVFDEIFKFSEEILGLKQVNESEQILLGSKPEIQLAH